MSANKNPLIRYKVLDRCFRNPGRRYFLQDLIDECNKVLLEIDSDSKGISRRQIFDDLFGKVLVKVISGKKVSGVLDEFNHGVFF